MSGNSITQPQGHAGFSLAEILSHDHEWASASVDILMRLQKPTIENFVSCHPRKLQYAEFVFLFWVAYFLRKWMSNFIQWPLYVAEWAVLKASQL